MRTLTLLKAIFYVVLNYGKRQISLVESAQCGQKSEILNLSPTLVMFIHQSELIKIINHIHFHFQNMLSQILALGLLN